MGPTQFTWVGLDPCDGFDWIEKTSSTQPNPIHAHPVKLKPIFLEQSCSYRGKGTYSIRGAMAPLKLLRPLIVVYKNKLHLSLSLSLCESLNNIILTSHDTYSFMEPITPFEISQWYNTTLHY